MKARWKKAWLENNDKKRKKEKKIENFRLGKNFLLT